MCYPFSAMLLPWHILCLTPLVDEHLKRDSEGQQLDFVFSSSVLDISSSSYSGFFCFNLCVSGKYHKKLMSQMYLVEDKSSFCQPPLMFCYIGSFGVFFKQRYRLFCAIWYDNAVSL